MLAVGAGLVINKGDVASAYIDDIGRRYPAAMLLDPADTLRAAGRCSYSGRADLYYLGAAARVSSR
jgi:hypothetical protein